MTPIKYLIFRYLTSADYFNIYKPSGTEEGGGGQAYIDFPVALVTLSSWGKFFEGAESVYCSTAEQGPIWELPINSIDLNDSQDLKIYQRRPQSVCIASQRITSRVENRVKSWHPDNGFPSPKDPSKRNIVPDNLAIYVIRTMRDEFWAGWFSVNNPCKDQKSRSLLKDMFKSPREDGYAGFVDLNGELFLDEKDSELPFNSL